MTYDGNMAWLYLCVWKSKTKQVNSRILAMYTVRGSSKFLLAKGYQMQQLVCICVGVCLSWCLRLSRYIFHNLTTWVARFYSPSPVSPADLAEILTAYCHSYYHYIASLPGLLFCTYRSLNLSNHPFTSWSTSLKNLSTLGKSKNHQTICIYNIYLNISKYHIIYSKTLPTSRLQLEKSR